MKFLVTSLGVILSFSSMAQAETCIEVKENKRYFDRALKAYQGLPKEPCIKLPYLEKNLSPLALRANKSNQTAFLAVKSKLDPKLNEVHYIDTKEGKLIKKFNFKGHLNRSFINLSDTFVPFDDDSKLAFSKDKNLCIFDLRKSEKNFSKNYKAPLHYCVRPNLGSGTEVLDDLRSLTLSKNKAGTRYLWSLMKSKGNKYIYGFKINKKGEIQKSALHKFKLPKNLNKATHVSYVDNQEGGYTFALSTSKKNPEGNLYKVDFNKNKNNSEFKVSNVEVLSSGRQVASNSKKNTSDIEILDFINLEKLYR